MTAPLTELAERVQEARSVLAVAHTDYCVAVALRHPASVAAATYDTRLDAMIAAVRAHERARCREAIVNGAWMPEGDDYAKAYMTGVRKAIDAMQGET